MVCEGLPKFGVPLLGVFTRNSLPFRPGIYGDEFAILKVHPIYLTECSGPFCISRTQNFSVSPLTMLAMRIWRLFRISYTFGGPPHPVKRYSRTVRGVGGSTSHLPFFTSSGLRLRKSQHCSARPRKNSKAN